ncbi:hypothetical protein PPACK8108_LOCUS6531 [Phakopsora pachyrhizi]|uniref:Uncharacterized protein n=1 Tax=Phakopsora pachyrhizi TaxID=170000 RepID=A0AAV0AUI4_PHAPC|nr:hypothetical protein PPACK8108_LOCUS6531 [Phakopsora pachyrhizi]
MEYQTIKIPPFQKKQGQMFSINAITSFSSDELWKGDIRLVIGATESLSSNQALLVNLRQLDSPISNLSPTDSDSSLGFVMNLLKTYEIEGSEALLPKSQRNPDYGKLNHLPGCKNLFCRPSY